MRSLCRFVVALVLSLALPAASAEAATPACDPVCKRSLAQLKVFTKWLKRFKVKGYIGEVGWPDYASDAARWDSVGQQWFDAANKAHLPVTMWATGEWWGSSYELSVFEPTLAGQSVNKDNTQAPVYNANAQEGGWRGINDNGGEFGASATAPTSSFSNTNPGRYDEAYHYDSSATFEFLAAQGVKTVRLPFRWERMQPVLGGPLDTNEVARVRAAVDRASAAGMNVVLDMHNYGGYYRSDGTTGIRRTVGSDELPIASFADAWQRISTAFKDDSGVYAYDLMNEPVGIGGDTPAKTWEQATRAAVSTIRANGDNTWVMVPGYNWSGAWQWTSQHPRPWVKAKHIRYEAHHYLDSDHSGSYQLSYDQEASNARAAGY